MSIGKIFKKFNKSEIFLAPEYIICGLGNPGLQYENTRHNAGFMVVDKFCKENNIKCNRIKFKSLVGSAVVNGKKIIVMKPSTYMNKSGEAVVEAMNFYKVQPQRVILVFDDISLDVGKMRIRNKGSHGGQNGVKNIIYLSGSDDFPRIKIGIGNKPHPDYDLAAWVLSGFTKQEGPLLEKSIEDAANSLMLMIDGKIQQAMNKYNS